MNSGSKVARPLGRFGYADFLRSSRSEGPRVSSFVQECPLQVPNALNARMGIELPCLKMHCLARAQIPLPGQNRAGAIGNYSGLV